MWEDVYRYLTFYIYYYCIGCGIGNYCWYISYTWTMRKDKIQNLLGGAVVAKKVESLLFSFKYTSPKPRLKKHYSIFKYSTKK